MKLNSTLLAWRIYSLTKKTSFNTFLLISVLSSLIGMILYEQLALYNHFSTNFFEIATIGISSLRFDANVHYLLFIILYSVSAYLS